MKHQGYSMDNVCTDRPVFIALTERGATLARRLLPLIPGAELHGLAGRVAEADCHFEQAKAWIASLFDQGRPVIGICAAGILVRSVAPLLIDKRAEPPVLAIAEDGSAVVPLLGGHHGANEWAGKLAGALESQAAITTAGDRRFGLALDAPPRGWRLAARDQMRAKEVMAALLAGKQAVLDIAPELEAVDPVWLREADLPLVPAAGGDETLSLRCSLAPAEADFSGLTFHPAMLAVGLGCERGTSLDELRSLLRESLAEAGLALEAVGVLASLDLKEDETALLALSAETGIPVRFFPAERLEQEKDRLQNPSDVVFEEVGCHGVAEGAALAAAGQGGKLVAGKRKSVRATCAIARASGIVDPARTGKPRGHLAVIGTGPGDRAWRTPECESLAVRADVLVGYGLYLDLLGPAVAGKPREGFELGEETARVERALDLAAEGKRVALVCSGDPGIYAMASLAWERVEFGQRPDWQRVELQVSPGISALQGAAARIGAPIGHDFCTISLSDLMTPWEAIERRIQAAAAGDFVVAFYNPVSRRRRTQLARAKEILLTGRPAATPVILGRNMGRPEEEMRIVPLGSLNIDEVDMLTVVLVGSSESRLLTLPNGERRVYTPRGYKGKQWSEGAQGSEQTGKGDPA